MEPYVATPTVTPFISWPKLFVAKSNSNPFVTALKSAMPTGNAAICNHRPCTSNFVRISPAFSFREKCVMNVPLMSDDLPVNAALLTNVAVPAINKKCDGNSGVNNSIARDTSSSEFAVDQKNFGFSSNFFVFSAPNANVAKPPVPSFNTHFAAPTTGAAAFA